MTVAVTHDAAADVLYLKRGGACLVNSVEDTDDCDLIFNRDAAGDVAGAQVLRAAAWAGAWLEHPSRLRLPDDLRAALEEWAVQTVAGRPSASTSGFGWTITNVVF